MSKLQEALKRSKHNFQAAELSEMEAALLSEGYDLSETEYLGEGYEGVAIYIEFEGMPRALRVCTPLSHSWEPDWGHREFDCQLFEVEGQETHVMQEGSSYWYVQEYGEEIHHPDDIQPDLWEELEELISRRAGQLFSDVYTALIEQVCLVERDDGIHLRVHDYGAFSALPIGCY